MSNVNDEIQKKIDYIAKKNNIFHLGKVVKINSFIIEVTGLDDAFYFEKVIIGNQDNIGYVDRILANKVIISLVKTNGLIKINDTVTTTGEILQASYSRDSIGMIIDPFGYDKMTGKKINNSILIPIETPKIGIMDRTAVNRPLETGIAGIDLMFPIGRGQRQIIIGDKKTGKTQICLDAIVNQKNKDTICIYVSIGKTKKELKRFYSKLVEKGAHTYTLIVATFNDDMVPLIKLTPYVALSIAELYMREGKDVLVCIDDLKKHADACREIALIAEKNTGRDEYPADIFYTHSRLLEKGCQHKDGGSITILPIVETKGEDITDYISTNIISISDGQIVLSEKMFKKGQKPAIDFGLSVSRLGSAVQKESIRKIGAKVRRELLSYLETADVYQLVNIESMSDEFKEKILRGKKILDLLKQPKFYCFDEQMLIEKFSFINENTNMVNDDNANDSDDSKDVDDSKNNNIVIDDEKDSKDTVNVQNKDEKEAIDLNKDTKGVDDFDSNTKEDNGEIQDKVFVGESTVIQNKEERVDLNKDTKDVDIFDSKEDKKEIKDKTLVEESTEIQDKEETMEKVNLNKDTKDVDIFDSKEDKKEIKDKALVEESTEIQDKEETKEKVNLNKVVDGTKDIHLNEKNNVNKIWLDVKDKVNLNKNNKNTNVNKANKNNKINNNSNSIKDKVILNKNNKNKNANKANKNNKINNNSNSIKDKVNSNKNNKNTNVNNVNKLNNNANKIWPDAKDKVILNINNNIGKVNNNADSIWPEAKDKVTLNSINDKVLNDNSSFSDVLMMSKQRISGGKIRKRFEQGNNNIFPDI